MRNRVCLLLALVWVSWPGHSCVAALLVEAENANIRTVGGAQGDVWNLWSNGEVGDYVHFENEGPYSLAVRAYGSLCAGVWPLMGVAVDDEFVETRPVDSAVLKEYTFPIHVAPGVYKITAVFMNDHREGLEDRNLYLDVMEIRPGEGMPEAARGDEAAWEHAWRLRSAELEDRTLEAARAAIEQNRKTAATLVVVDERGAPAPQAQVSVKQVTHDFLFGCNIYKFDGYRSKAENDQYKQRFADLFNYATTGFYWKWYEQKQGQPQYGATDKVVAWCAAHDIRLKGHPLLWGNEAGRPGWTGGLPSPELQEKRVREIVGRYKGRIEFWEVVNEPAHVLNIAIDQPYRWARETDPEAHLIVNDYAVMATGYPPFFDLLEAAIGRGVPFDGIGIQAHEPRTMRFPLFRVKAHLDKYASFGKALHITEFTPTSSGLAITGSHIEGGWDEAAQADYAVKFYTVCFAHPAVAAITWWDLCDDGSWLEGGGLLRKDLSPKPAYTALLNLIHEDWHTNSAGRTDEEGRFQFRGFYGQYTVEAEHQGKTAKQTIQLRQGSPENFSITLN